MSIIVFVRGGTRKGLLVLAVLVSLLAPVSAGASDTHAKETQAKSVAEASSILEILRASDYSDQLDAPVLRLYQAYFDRQPDLAGAKYWLGVRRQGHRQLAIAKFMAASQEFANNYQSVSDEVYLTRVYQNMLGRDADESGYNYWLDAVRGTNEFGGNPNRTDLSRGEVVFYVTAGQEFIRNYPYDSTGNTGSSFLFTAGGDIGALPETTDVLKAMAKVNPRFFLALGDLGYSDSPSEAAWCRYVESHLGSIPMQIVVGNHEDDDRQDGYIGEYLKCLPDHMNSTGLYGVEYYFDVDGLARFIMIASDNEVEGVSYDYDKGSERYRWLELAIDDAREQQIPWVIVGMHKVCISTGDKRCAIGSDVIDLLIDKKVDLVLHAHDHNYQRSKQVSCVEVNLYRPECIVDDGSDNAYTKDNGMVWVVSGLMGHGSKYPIHDDDPEFEYFATAHGGNSPDAGRGFSQILVSYDKMVVDFIGTTTKYRDHFTISR
ncbi:MAG: DUF4214 domain-containing protein [Acidimicrobiales bacterium]|nr:DUF4214 domain-containing protein [Acidimicrobiales bacterium]